MATLLQHLADKLRYRTVCDTLVLADFEFAHKKNVEPLLWDAHSRVNNRYRKQLSYVRISQVELEEHFLT